MTRDPNGNRNDDPAIEQLVRDVVEGWSMPPVRLDAPSWRDRVRSPRSRRLAAAGGWLRRFGQAATAAVALTVVGALVAVLLTRPPTEPGKSPGPSGAAPSPSGRVQATPLPRLMVTGDEPDPSVVVVRNERGDFSRVDLSTGTINGPLTGKSSFSELRLEDGGAVLCLCVAESGSIGTMPTDMAVTVERYDGRGKLVSSMPIASFSGEPDPRDESVSIPEHPAHVLTEIGYSADGRYGFVGFSFRAHPVWRSGILVVNLADGSITDRFELPDATDGDGDYRRVVAAPKVAGTIGSGSVLIARAWYEWTPPSSRDAIYTDENQAFTASFADGAFSDLKAVPNASDCGSVVSRAGSLPDGGFWLACTDGGAQLTVVRRLDAGGALLEDVRVSGGQGIETDPTALSADGSTLFVWDPGGAALTRVNLATGERRTGQGIAAAEPGPFAALGSWLAPTASAKSWLRGALVISPDGSRVYAIGVKAGVGDRDEAGSSGVFAFDASTLQPLAIYQPTADFISVAVSGDGRFVYASGLPGVDAAGRTKLTQQASITVFDTSDGTIRLIAGQLGGDALMFLSPVLD